MGCTTKDVKAATKAANEGVECLWDMLSLHGRFDNSDHGEDQAEYDLTVADRLKGLRQRFYDIHDRIEASLPKAVEAFRNARESLGCDTSSDFTSYLGETAPTSP
jgi:hypothetical protein